MLSCGMHPALAEAENFDHWFAYCWRALFSSLIQVFSDWSTEIPWVAAVKLAASDYVKGRHAASNRNDELRTKSNHGD